MGHTAAVAQLRGARCLTSCHFGGVVKSHHDRLLRVDRDPDQVLDLLELALTWDELDYGAQHLIEPASWDDFVASHRWQDRVQAMRVFSMASGIVMRGRRSMHVEAHSASVFSALTGQPAVVLPGPMPVRH